MRLSIRTNRRLFFLFCFLVLSACGGGGSSGSSESGNTTESPSLITEITLKATGPSDMTIDEGKTVTVRGTAVLTNSNKPISYFWEEMGSSYLTFSNPNAPVTSMSAGEVPDDTTVLVAFSVTTDDFNVPPTDFFNVTIHHDNQSPTVSAGPDVTTREGERVSLAATASDNDGHIESYWWSQLSGPHVRLDEPSSVSPKFTAVEFSDQEPRELVFRVMVTDDDGATAVDQVTVVVREYSRVGPLTDVDEILNRIAENASVGSAVGVTARADEPTPDDVVTYSILDEDSAQFAIDSSSGKVTLASPLDFDSASRHQFTVVAQSTDGSSSQRAFNLVVVEDSGTSLDIDFPIDGATFAGPDLLVRGRINDPNPVAASVGVSIGGSTVTVTPYENGEFVARSVPVVPSDGYATVQVDVTHSDATLSNASLGLLTNLSFEWPLDPYLDSGNQRVLAIDSKIGALLAVDLSTGLHSVVAEDPAFRAARKSDFDPTTKTLYFASWDSVHAFDLDTSTVSTLADEATGSGVPIDTIRAIAFDSARTRILYADSERDELVAIDPASGERTLVSGPTRGAGETLANIVALECAQSSPVCYAYQVLSDSERLFSIDVDESSSTCGDRAVLLSEILHFSGTLILDEANNRLFIWEGRNPRIHIYDFSTQESNTHRFEYPGPENYLFDSTMVATFDAANERLLTLDIRAGGLLSVNLADLALRPISKMHLTEGRSYHLPNGIALDWPNNRYFVSDFHRSTVWEVNAVTGERVNLRFEITDGDSMNNPVALDYSATLNQVVVADRNGAAIGKIDLSTSVYEIIADSSDGIGATFEDLTDLVFDSNSEALRAYDEGSQDILSVDLESGDRTPLFSTLSENGLNWAPGIHLDRDAMWVANRIQDGGWSTRLERIDLATQSIEELARFPLYARFVALDTVSGTAYTIGFLLPENPLLSVDIWSGEETITPSRDWKDGAIISSAETLAWDEGNGNLYVVGNRQIIVLDPLSNDRLMVNK